VSDAQKALDAAKRNAKAAENEISELKNAGKEYQKALAAFEKPQKRTPLPAGRHRGMLRPHLRPLKRLLPPQMRK
jgi:hypothetical protein